MPAGDDRRPGSGLTRRLLLAVAALTVCLGVFLLTYVGPNTTRGFTARSDALLAQGATAMERLASDLNRQHHDVIVELIAQTTDARRRTLADLPLELYADLDTLRAAIRDEDHKRGSRLRQNAATLAAETQRRAATRIAQDIERLEQQQAAAAAAFGRELRWIHVALCSAFVAIAMALLGAGLHRAVVRPVARLREATRRIAGGDLSAMDVPAAHDEIGQLAADFATMLAQLRQSRQELDRLNQDLEREVAAKTRHLEQALHDLRQSHRELAHAERMAAIGTLAGGIAHEFNNLIGGIRGCAGELLRDEPDAERRETLRVILRAADRATSITSQLLRFSRQPVRERTAVDLDQVARDALALVEPEARRRSVTVQCEFTARSKISGDADALHQVCVNLLNNALQAMPAGGCLTVRTADTGGNLVLEIADTGVGIAEDDLGRIFEPFFSRRTDPGRGAPPGTGLGLAVSYGIVQSHGGAIEVESALGRGTTFRVRLPAITAP